MTEPYFATGYVRLLYRFARAEGVSEAQLLRGTGTDEAGLMSAASELPFAQQMCLTANALKSADPGLGLRVGHQLQLAAHGPLGTAMQCARDLHTALAVFAEFIDARASILAVRQVLESREVSIEVETRHLPEALVPFFNESVLFTLTHCLSFYSGQRRAVTSIQLGYSPPPYAHHYAAVFGGPAEFGCVSTRVRFDAGLLALPSPEADADVFAASVDRCRNLIARRQPQQDIARRIDDFLLENPGKLWTLEEIAPLFAVSSRTLMRNLAGLGTSYQAIRDRALQRQATTYLTSMSVEAAAIALGFADTSSFRRTFRRWYGVTPSEYRSTVLARG